MHRFKWLIGACIASAVVAGGVQAADQTVTATSSSTFSPSDVTITQGEKVTWTNQGGVHNVKFSDGSFEMPADPSAAGWQVERTFDQPGNFTYFCEEHAYMTGVVRVTAATPPSDGGGGGGGSGGGTGGGSDTPTRPKVTLELSDARPAAGQRVRLFGFVRPELDGTRVQIQRRTRTGSFRQVARTLLRDAGEGRSRFSLRIRIARDGVFRARIPAGADREAAISPRKRLNVL
jgi:plastocyanin